MDYAKEGRELLQRVNLQLDGAPERYSDVNPVYLHPPTNATLFVGNARASQSRETLASIDCTRIVFCQQPGEGKMAFAKDPAFKYLAYPIGLWRQKLSLSPKPAATLQYFEPLFRFVEGELAEGNNVMIHCLAVSCHDIAGTWVAFFSRCQRYRCGQGAHRAGTAGVACLMHLADLDRATATTIAQTARPAINPIG